MKMEQVKRELENWGEIIVSTAAGDQFELHLGDTTFDMENQTITLQTPYAIYVIAGDAIENITKHYGKKIE